MHERHLLLWEHSEFLQNKNIESIIMDHQRIVVRTKSGVRLICDPQDKRHMFMEILNFNDYEAAELKMMKLLLKKNSIILDIGANVGWYSIHLARQVPQGKIFAFEPIPRTYDFLTENIALNGLTNIKTYKIGFSDKAGFFNFYYNRDYPTATSLKDIMQGNDVALVKCRVERLDDFLKKHRIKHFDFIKCDVEGAEKFVIEGGSQAIAENKPIIFLELLRKWSAKFNYHPNDVINALAHIGYACCEIAETRLQQIEKITDATESTNFYFLHKTHHASLLRKFAR